MDNVWEALEMPISILVFILLFLSLWNFSIKTDEINEVVSESLTNKTSISDNGIYMEDKLLYEADSIIANIIAYDGKATFKIDGNTISEGIVTKLKNGNTTAINSYVSQAREYVRKLTLDANGDIKVIEYSTARSIYE